jgi:protein gp37
MNKTKIEWCDRTWNPVTGCLHGCEYCYARRIAKRFGLHLETDTIQVLDKKYSYETYCIMTGEKDYISSSYPYDFTPTFHRYRLHEPQRIKKPQNIFVCSMADLFGEWLPDEWIEEVFKACEKAPQHNYLFLTKNLKSYKDIEYTDNIWLGNTITKQNDFIKEYGRPLNAKRFYSIEPILEPIRLPLNNIPKKNVQWLILGAETGNRKNKVVPKKEWIDSIVGQCRELDIPVFMKDSLVSIVGEENMLREFPEGLRRKDE